MTYRVHIYAVVRVPVTVEAESQEDAISKAAKTDLYELDTSLSAWDAEYADEIDGYLVDEEGDEEFERSMWYDNEGRPDTQLGADIAFHLHTQMTEGKEP